MPEEIVPRVHRLGNRFVNFYAVEAEGRLTVVDAGVAGFGKTLEADLRSIGRTPADVDAVVLTHADADHTGIALALRAEGARVLIHAGDEGLAGKARPRREATPARSISSRPWCGRRCGSSSWPSRAQAP